MSTTFVTCVPTTVYDCTQGAFDFVAWHDGSGPLVTSFPCASTKGTSDWKQVVPVAVTSLELYLIVTVRLPVKVESVIAAVGTTRAWQWLIWNGAPNRSTVEWTAVLAAGP